MANQELEENPKTIGKVAEIEYAVKEKDLELISMSLDLIIKPKIEYNRSYIKILNDLVGSNMETASVIKNKIDRIIGGRIK